MISAVFVDRPRLAIVISVVISLAGLIALTAIPIAQFPDIVPPQVSVTTTYPGAGSDVVEATVAQPIESAIVGVDSAMTTPHTTKASSPLTKVWPGTLLNGLSPGAATGLMINADETAETP